jgi:hypothetical protein
VHGHSVSIPVVHPISNTFVNASVHHFGHSSHSANVPIQHPVVDTAVIRRPIDGHSVNILRDVSVHVSIHLSINHSPFGYNISLPVLHPSRIDPVDIKSQLPVHAADAITGSVYRTIDLHSVRHSVHDYSSSYLSTTLPSAYGTSTKEISQHLTPVIAE